MTTRSLSTDRVDHGHGDHRSSIRAFLHCSYVHSPDSDLGMSSSNIPSLQDSKATETSLQVIPLDHTFWLYQFPTTQPLPEILQKRIFQSSISNSDTKSSNDRNQEDKQSGKGFVTVTRNVEEWSIMIEMDEEEDNLRKELQPFLGSDSPEEDKEDGGKARKREGKEEGPWSCLKVRGPMVLSKLHNRCPEHPLVELCINLR